MNGINMLYYSLTVLLEYIDFCCNLHKCRNIVISIYIISYYAGIKLNAFSDPLYSKLYWDNRWVPSFISHILSLLHVFIIHLTC